MPKLLLVDDEEGVRYAFRRVFQENDVQVLTAGTAAEGLAATARMAFGKIKTAQRVMRGPPSPTVCFCNLRQHA